MGGDRCGQQGSPQRGQRRHSHPCRLPQGGADCGANRIPPGVARERSLGSPCRSGRGQPPVGGTTYRYRRVYQVGASIRWAMRPTYQGRTWALRPEAWAYVRDAVRPSVRPKPCDPPAKRRPSVVPGWLRAHTRRVRPRALGGWGPAGRGAGSSQAPATHGRGVAWVRSPWGGDEEEILHHDAAPDWARGQGPSH